LVELQLLDAFFNGLLAGDLLHLPGKPAGVAKGAAPPF